MLVDGRRAEGRKYRRAGHTGRVSGRADCAGGSWTRGSLRVYEWEKWRPSSTRHDTFGQCYIQQRSQ